MITGSFPALQHMATEMVIVTAIVVVTTVHKMSPTAKPREDEEATN